MPHELTPFDAAADEGREYFAMSPLAIVGLLLGLAAPLALIGPMLWIVPWMGIAAAALALRRIAVCWPELAGRNIALAGLVLSIAMAVAAPVNMFVHRWQLRAEARQFAELWFEAIREGQPQKAHQLTLEPHMRRPLDDRLVDAYRSNATWRAELKTSVLHPPTRALLALGPKALVRYYETVDQDHNELGDWARLIYAVTYDDKGERTTFFVAILLQRSALDNGRANWRFMAIDGGVRPPGW